MQVGFQCSMDQMRDYTSDLMSSVNIKLITTICYYKETRLLNNIDLTLYLRDRPYFTNIGKEVRIRFSRICGGMHCPAAPLSDFAGLK